MAAHFSGLLYRHFNNKKSGVVALGFWPKYINDKYNYVRYA
jgi:hypothetical protein